MSTPSRPEPSRRRRLDGWGFEGEAFPPPAEMMAWLVARLGAGGEPFPRWSGDATAIPAATAIPELPGELAREPLSRDPLDRLAHSRGRGTPDLLRLRSGTVRQLPAAVARPADAEAVARLLAACAEHGIRVVPWGGGTSVTGGVNAPPGEAPSIALDLERLSGLEALDEESGLAEVGAGTLGPDLEAALATRGFTLGHFPQSFELSTVGGWIVTRSAGQESLGYGRIEDLLAGLDLVAPGGRLSLPAIPASAAGPDLRQLVLGSEGRLGIVTRASLRVRRRPEASRVEAVLLPSWGEGLAAARTLVQDGVGLSLLRLSDRPETEMAMAVGLARTALGGLVRAWLRFRGIGGDGCLLLLGAAGRELDVDTALEEARTALRPFGAVWLGEGPGKRWLADRFRHPYLRDALLDRGIASDTLETAAPWSRLPALYAAVRAALGPATAVGEREVPVLCHLSHPYRDGASLYFTLFFRCPPDGDAAVARWADLKRRATAAIAAAGGTVSHHHGVGSWHAPWLAPEVGADGVRLLTAAAATLDPSAVLGPHLLLDPTDRLEL